MYLALNESYRYLQAYEVVLFTIVTPILVTLCADLLDRTLRIRALGAALLAVAGASLVVMRSTELDATLKGFVLVQLSNGAFAVGQVAYQRVRRRHRDLRDREVFALLYAGACVVTTLVMLVRVDVASLTVNSTQAWTLLYLGVLASGIGFFLWNVGATRVRSGTLAVMNNAKAPLGVVCSLVFFGERVTNPRLLLASVVLFSIAVWLVREKPEA
jgi:drug/metabolite transporter (DMT)-like permease